MFWRKSGHGSPEQGPEESRESGLGPIQIGRDAERPATILRVAGELENRGAEIVELFKEIQTPRGRAVLPIHLRWQGQDFFVEIETRPWKGSNVEKALDTVAVLRGSEYEEAGLGLLSAYPVPEEVNFFFSREPAALLQLDLYAGKRESPEERADLFVESVRRRWGTELDYELGRLSQVEESLAGSLLAGADPARNRPPLLASLAECLGCYVGEVIRRNSAESGTWSAGHDEGPLLELDDFVLDPIGNARAFLENGPEDSVDYYARYVLREIGKSQEPA